MRRLLILTSTLVMCACTSLAPVREANETVNFNMDARFAVKYMEDDKDKSLTGKMQWEETRRATDIILATPIGTSMASLHVTRNEAVLKTANGDMFSEKTPEELLRHRLQKYVARCACTMRSIGWAHTVHGKPARS
jgi:outer membrane biogenesis lipoprotein LolB